MPKTAPSQEPPPFDPSIDETRLDQACLAQPVMFDRAARQLADARRALAEAKQERDVTYAEVSLAVRDDPAAYKLTKVTEDTVKAAVAIAKPYREAVADVIRAEHRVDVLKAATDALGHRKTALESLVYLHGQNYYAAPRVPDNADTGTRDRGWGRRRTPPNNTEG